MKTKTRIHDPEFRIFLKFFIFNFGVMLLLGTFMYLIFDFGAPLMGYLESVGFMLFLYPLINSIIGTYGARQLEFTIFAIEDPRKVADWVVSLLQKNEMQIIENQQNQTILEPAGKFLRWYGNQFGAGLATVSFTESEVTIAGSSKAVDVIDTKIKFGRVEFLEQPYKHS